MRSTVKEVDPTLDGENAPSSRAEDPDHPGEQISLLIHFTIIPPQVATTHIPTTQTINLVGHTTNHRCPKTI